MSSNRITWQSENVPGSPCDSGGFSVNTAVVGRGAVARSRTKPRYPVGSPLTLTAEPAAGDRFTAWSGDTATTQPSLDIVVTREVYYTATFERDSAWAAKLQSATDAPGDQGSQVVASWLQSPLDDALYPGLLCCYQVQRRPEADPNAPWVAAAEIPVSGAPSYLAPVPSPEDSTASGPALYRYRLLTKAAADTFAWVSNEVVGYSVDNLAPPAPSYVTGSIASGSATLFWPAVGAPDVQHYRVYRSVEDVPAIDAQHRIGTTTVTGFNDSPGVFAHYAVTAVDTHGNEGQATVFVPSNVADVGGRSAPRSLVVGAPSPSPMSRSMTMSIGFPREMRATVDVRDAQGRTVRRIGHGTYPAGWASIGWDARDASGRAASAGIYFVHVQTPVGERVSRLVLVP